MTARGPGTEVQSWAELREHVRTIAGRLNEEEDLAVAAAANPVLALEELGYRIAPGARGEIVDRLRFPPEEAGRRRRLRRRIFERAGREFDLQSAEALHRVLFVDLGITPYPDEKGCVPPPPDTHPLPHRQGDGEPTADPLASLKGRHPIVEPLLEYRRLDASRPRFAPEHVYRAIRDGGREHGVLRLRVRLRDAPEEGAAPAGDRSPAPGGAGEEAETGPAPVDLNTAGEDELVRLPGIGSELAGRILAYRQAHGPFASVSELTAVSGIGDRLAERLTPHVTVREA